MGDKGKREEQKLSTRTLKEKRKQKKEKNEYGSRSPGYGLPM